MLRSKTIDIDGEQFTIQQASVYRVMRFRKQLTEAANREDEEQATVLVLELVAHCLGGLNAQTLGDEISVGTLNKLQTAILSFSTGMDETDAKSQTAAFDTLIEDAEKNSTPTPA